MASRPKNNSASLDLIKAFVTLQSFEVTEDDPVSTEDFAAEMGVTPAEAFAALDALADAELVDAKGRGLSAEWWIAVPDVSAENAESIAREALDGMVQVVKDEPRKLTDKEQAYKDRTAYNAYADERAQGFVSSEVIPAVSPVIAENGETVTIPVDWDNSEAGRRELDASKGERLISEEVIPMRSRDKGLAVVMQDGEPLYESSIEKHGLALSPPASIPTVPDGVTRNFWYMAHAAITQSARDYWAEICARQAEEFEINKGAPAPF